MSPFGTLLAAADEIPRRAAALNAASPCDLRILAEHLALASDKVRVIAQCFEPTRQPLADRRAALNGRAAA